MYSDGSNIQYIRANWEVGT